MKTASPILNASAIGQHVSAFASSNGNLDEEPSEMVEPVSEGVETDLRRRVMVGGVEGSSFGTPSAPTSSRTRVGS